MDYFIRGDNELPMDLILAGTDPHKIPNLVGRDFENKFSYQFGLADFARLEFNLDWFPSYLRRLAEVRKKPSVELYQKGMPPYYLPMLYSVKSGCLAAHEGCDYCLGSRRDIFRDMYGREALPVKNDQLIAMLKAVERKFPAVTLMMMSKPDYDFRGEHFDLEATIEFDSPVSLEQLSRILPAFREANVHVAVYQEGLAGKSLRRDLQKILECHNERHRYYLFSFSREKKILAGLPEERLLPSEIVLPRFTDYRICSDLQNAFTLSHESFARVGASTVFLSADLGERFKTFLLEQGVPKGTRAIIRADTAGCLDVLAAEIGDWLELAGKGTGDIRPADLARAAACDATVIGYNVGVEREAVPNSSGARLLLVRPVLSAESEEYSFTRV